MRLYDGQLKAPREIVCEPRRAPPRNRAASGRDDQRRRCEVPLIRRDLETIRPAYFAHATAESYRDTGRGAFRREHRDDRARRSIAKELAQRLFVVCDP